MKIRILVNILIVSFLLLGIFGCTSEEINKKDPEPEKENVPLRIPITKAEKPNETVTDQDTRITKVRLLVFSTGSSPKVLVNKLLENQDNVKDILFEEEVPAGNVNLYLIANERDSQHGDNWNLGTEFVIGTTASPETLKAKIRNYNSAYPVVNASSINYIPMYSQMEYVHVGLEGATINGVIHTSDQLGEKLGELKRLYAKVTLNLSCNFSDLTSSNGGEAIELRSLSIDSLPKQSYLAPKRYEATSGNEYFLGAAKTRADDPAYISNSSGFSGKFVFYIPEFLADNLTHRAYVSLRLGLVAMPGVQSEYKLILGNGMTNNGNNYMKGPNVNVSDISLTRNTHYLIDAKIKAFNQTSGSDLDIIAKIVDWNATSTDPEEPQEYSLTILESEITVPTGLGTSASNLYEYMVYIETDHKNGWDATSSSSGLSIESKSGNKLVFKITGGNSWVIHVTAGKITKQIKISR